ncbi:MAG: hypothetical protein AAGC60_16435 [Acidobacteriota bacterium]
MVRLSPRRRAARRSFGAALTGAILLALAVVVTAGPAFAAPSDTKVMTASGQTANGSFYQFMVPDDWQPADGLVIWNHGYSLDPIGPDPDLGPLVDVQLAQGYAVAASSYSQIGWAVFNTVTDLEEMVRIFEQDYGVPERVLIYGASLGGLVTVQAIEQADLGNVVGAMPICGALAGSRIWDAGIDLRLLYDLVCDGVPGGEIPGGATGLPFPPDPTFDGTALGEALFVCLGIGLEPADRSAAQQGRLDELLAVAGIPENFVDTDMGFATFGTFDLIFSPDKLAGAQGLDNFNTDYGVLDVNVEIPRVMADPAARERLLDNYTPSGKVGDVKIVSLHTDKDGLVLLENETDYASKVPAGNFSLGIVVEDVPSHCEFTPAELAGGWESLRGWVAGAPQPSPAVLQSTCEEIEGTGLAAGPCRIDPNATLPDVATRIRPRDTCFQDANTLCLRDDRFRVQVSWEDFEGNTGPGIVTPQTNDTGSFWFFSPENLELMVKVLDGRQLTESFWVFYGSLTNVEFEMTVTDTVTLRSKTYENPLGSFASVGDTEGL